MGAKRVSKQGVTVSQGNAIEVTNTAGTVLFSVNNAGSVNTLANLTAKGDLLTASAASTPAVLAAPTEQGSTLVADSAATTGLRWQGNFAAGKNRIINSNFSIWQRGTSFTSSANTYGADRWLMYKGGANQTTTRQVTGDTTNLPNIQYCARIQKNSGSTDNQVSYLQYAMESVDSIPLSGQTVTLSFYARRGANYSASSNVLVANLYSGTGTDQTWINGMTGVATVISQNATLTTTWQRFSYSANVSSSATQLNVVFAFTPTGTAGANDYYEITGVQLEAGSVATAFQTATGTIQGELAACQRYYSKSARTATAPADGNTYSTDCLYQMQATNSTTVLLTSFFSFPMNMRVAPTMTFYRSDLSATNGKWGYYSGSWNAGTTTVTSVLTDKGFAVEMGGTYTANNAYSIAGGWAASAEL